MKYFLFAVLWLTTGLGQAQDIPKGAVAITITTTLSDSAAFEKVVQLFNDNGYVVPEADYRTNQIVTQYNATLGPYTMRILAGIQQGVISIKGQGSLKNPGTRHLNDPVVYDTDNEVDISKKLFIELSKIAQQLAGRIEGAKLQYVLAAKQ